MDQGMAESLRLSLMLSLMCFTIQTVPELSLAARRPFLIFLRRVRKFRTFLAERRKTASKRSFWEIDMTQFEP